MRTVDKNNILLPVTITLPAALIDKVQRAADNRNITRAEYIRLLVLEKLKNA